MLRQYQIPLSILAMLATSAWLSAQHPNTPIFKQSGTAIGEVREEIIRQALQVRKQVAAISKEEIDAQLINPVPETIQLPPPFADTMSPEGIARHARENNLRVGYCYLCMNCDDWHLNLAGGYAIAKDVIATCDHVLVNKTKMRDGFLVVVDHEGNVACAVAILARSPAMDAAIVKVAGADFTPVPLNSDVMQGAEAFCFSYPLRQEGYFSTGVVNRFFWNEKYQGEDTESIDALVHLRANFSTDWAPGSSGSPLFDAAGNVIGHVSTISGLSRGNRQPALMMLRTGIPALAVRNLANHLETPAEIQRIAMIGAGVPESPENGDDSEK
ncbi:MAG: trypsin-like peptidase domain-containing protein [Luteolibacter sp.]|jgi:hypothetical protein